MVSGNSNTYLPTLVEGTESDDFDKTVQGNEESRDNEIMRGDFMFPVRSLVLLSHFTILVL